MNPSFLLFTLPLFVLSCGGSPRQATAAKSAPPLPASGGAQVSATSGTDAGVAQASPHDADLAEERALIERARSALIGGNPQEARAAAREHAQRFPNGRFVEERDLIATETEDPPVAGAHCPKTGSYACSVDSKTMFLCREGTWDLWRYCRGRDACQTLLTERSCDASISELGDPCGVPGSTACSPDSKLRLLCRRGKFVKDRECKTDACTVTEAKRIECR
ncbi:MAG: hypothetical protein HOO96_26595 [Polyangiaceae bacterium]|nr:hypothetical protein [Polyangiaceae bacterium]